MKKAEMHPVTVTNRLLLLDAIILIAATACRFFLDKVASKLDEGNDLLVDNARVLEEHFPAGGHRVVNR